MQKSWHKSTHRLFALKAKWHGLERKSAGNEKFSWQENSKIPLSNSIPPHTFFFCPRGHLMDYYLPNVDNHGHLANHHLPHFVHVVIERPLAWHIRLQFQIMFCFSLNSLLCIKFLSKPLATIFYVSNELKLASFEWW